MKADGTNWWEPLRRSYDELLLERLGFGGHLGEVAAYALQGGMRRRPMLAEAVGHALEAPQADVARVAVAVEYFHAASLLLDDLPAMDHADTRRGMPAAHLRFSPADAILAAIALIARAYAVVLGEDADDAVRGRRMARLASEAIGGAGMAAGQAEELALDTGPAPDVVEAIHGRKTATLFALVPQLISVAVDVTGPVSSALDRFATAFGAAYQIVDDLQDQDVAGEQRANLARTRGTDAARQRGLELLAEARAALAPLGPAATRLAQCTSWLEESLRAVR